MLHLIIMVEVQMVKSTCELNWSTKLICPEAFRYW